ncbi:MAG: hypothetical protein NTZ83_05520 [Candidatus Pacearchaeota archaeon]|nr:hypothetical protein [Candidatus Pacearchaeota archaeon]
MYYDIKIGSIFLSMNQREHQPWRRDIIVGSIDGNWKMHLATSGSATAEFHPLWFARVQDNILILNQNETTKNTSQLLSDCIPDILKVFQHPEQPLSLNVGSLDSFFLLQKKYLQL